MSKCGVLKALWENKYKDIFATNISGAVFGAITDPDGDGKVSLKDILYGIGGANVWRAYRNGKASAGLSMKIVNDFDKAANTLSEYPNVLTPKKVIDVFRSLKVDSQLSDFMSYKPEEIKKILELSLDAYLNPELHQKLWHTYGMYVPADFSIARMLDFHKLPEIAKFLSSQDSHMQLQLPHKTIDVTQKPLEASLGGYARGDEVSKTGEIGINSTHPINQKFASFVHEYEHLHQPSSITGVSPEYIELIKATLPKQAQSIPADSLYYRNIGELEARYIVALNDAVQNNDNAFLYTHPIVSMLNDSKGQLNFINFDNVSRGNTRTLEDAFALPKAITMNYWSPKPDEVIELLAIKGALDNKHLPLIYKELDKPGSVKINKNNLEDFVTTQEVENFLKARFNL